MQSSARSAISIDVLGEPTGVFPNGFGVLRRIAAISFADAVRTGHLVSGLLGCDQIRLFVKASTEEIANFAVHLGLIGHIQYEQRLLLAIETLVDAQPREWLRCQPFIAERLTTEERIALDQERCRIPENLGQVHPAWLDVWPLGIGEIHRDGPELVVYSTSRRTFVTA